MFADVGLIVAAALAASEGANVVIVLVALAIFSVMLIWLLSRRSAST